MLPEAVNVLRKAFARRTISPVGWRAGLCSEHLPNLPTFEPIEAGAIFFSVETTGREELERIIKHMAPGAVIKDTEISQTFTEKRMTCWS